MTLDSIIQKTLWVHQSTLLTSVVHREQQQIHLLCVSFTCPRSHVLVPAVELMSGAGPMHAPGSCGERCAGGCHVPFAREAHQRVAWGTTSALGFTSSTTLVLCGPQFPRTQHKLTPIRKPSSTLNHQCLTPCVTQQVPSVSAPGSQSCNLSSMSHWHVASSGTWSLTAPLDHLFHLASSQAASQRTTSRFSAWLVHTKH